MYKIKKASLISSLSIYKRNNFLLDRTRRIFLIDTQTAIPSHIAVLTLYMSLTSLCHWVLWLYIPEPSLNSVRSTCMLCRADVAHGMLPACLPPLSTQEGVSYPCKCVIPAVEM